MKKRKTGWSRRALSRQYRPWLLLVLAGTALALVPAYVGAKPLTRCSPREAGFDPAHLARIDGLVAEQIAKKRLPGCVVMIGRRGKIAFAKAYGHRRLQPSPEKMTLDTVFDMASLTKPMATATSIMLLVERGQVRLRNPVVEYLQEFAPHGKDAITIEDLLTHQGGLVPDNALGDYQHGVDEAWQRIWGLKLSYPVGEKFVYTDVGFLVLAKVRGTSDGEKRCLSSLPRMCIGRWGWMKRAIFRANYCGPAPRRPNNAMASGCEAWSTIRVLRCWMVWRDMQGCFQQPAIWQSTPT